MAIVFTVNCTRPNCHGFLADRNPTAATLNNWDTEHKKVCPVPEPPALAELRNTLLDLEECDDPDFGDWEHLVAETIMPAATRAAHLLRADES